MQFYATIGERLSVVLRPPIEEKQSNLYLCEVYDNSTASLGPRRKLISDFLVNALAERLGHE
ncbi:MAG: hypothetical protein SynsKO_04380 [Synoicihabitans sp.]